MPAAPGVLGVLVVLVVLAVLVGPVGGADLDVLQRLEMAVVDDDLAGSQVDLVADAGEVPAVLLKDALKGRLQPEGGGGARALELQEGVAARIHFFGSRDQLVGVRVAVVQGGRARSGTLGGPLHDGRMAGLERKKCGASARIEPRTGS